MTQQLAALADAYVAATNAHDAAAFASLERSPGGNSYRRAGFPARRLIAPTVGGRGDSTNFWWVGKMPGGNIRNSGDPRGGAIGFARQRRRYRAPVAGVSTCTRRTARRPARGTVL